MVAGQIIHQPNYQKKYRDDQRLDCQHLNIQKTLRVINEQDAHFIEIPVNDFARIFQNRKNSIHEQLPTLKSNLEPAEKKNFTPESFT